MVNIVARQDFGLEFLAKGENSKAKAKATKFGLRPRPKPRTNITALF